MSSPRQPLRTLPESSSTSLVKNLLPGNSLLRPVPDFDFKVEKELEFEVFSKMNFDDGRAYADVNNNVFLYAQARNHAIFTVRQLDDFIKYEAQYSKKDDSFPGIRFVVRVDMSVVFAVDGRPSPIVAAHKQMTAENAFCIAAGMAKRRVEEGVMIIEGGDNQTSGFRSSLQAWQFFAIALMETDEYKEGKIRFDTPSLIFKDVQTEISYSIATEKFIAQVTNLKTIYEDTLLSPTNRALYATKFRAFKFEEVPEGQNLNDYLTMKTSTIGSKRFERPDENSPEKKEPQSAPKRLQKSPPPTPARHRFSGGSKTSSFSAPGKFNFYDESLFGMSISSTSSTSSTGSTNSSSSSFLTDMPPPIPKSNKRLY